MPYSPKLAQRILAGATRKSLRAEGFTFSQKLFQELRAGPLRALQVVDAQIPKWAFKASKTPPPSMLLPSGVDSAMGRYTYRANIVIRHPKFGDLVTHSKAGKLLKFPYLEKRIIGRFTENRLLTGTEIREKMESIGEKAVSEDNLKNRSESEWVGGKVRHIEILTTLVNSD